MHMGLCAGRWHCARGGCRPRPSLIWRPILAALSLSLLTACGTLQAPELDQPSFQGMSALVSAATEEQPLEVLIIHGIGTPAPYQFEGFIQSLAQRLHLVQVPYGPSAPQNSGCYPTDPASAALFHPAPTPISIDGVVPDEDRAELYTYRFGPGANGPVTLKVNYLLWAPLTERIKCDLAKDDDKAPPKQAFANFARDFIDNKLGDVVLYGGTFRDKVMRPSVQAAFCLVRAERQAPTARHARPVPIAIRLSSSPTASAATC